MEQIQIRTPSLEQIQSHTTSLEHIQSRTHSMEQIQTRSSSFEHLQTPFSPSPIPICCRTPSNHLGKLQLKQQQRPKKVSFRLDDLPHRRPQTT